MPVCKATGSKRASGVVKFRESGDALFFCNSSMVIFIYFSKSNRGVYFRVKASGDVGCIPGVVGLSLSGI